MPMGALRPYSFQGAAIANRYLDRAEELRACAEGFRDPECRQTLRRLAEQYERMAERANAC